MLKDLLMLCIFDGDEIFKNIDEYKIIIVNEVSKSMMLFYCRYEKDWWKSCFLYYWVCKIFILFKFEILNVVFEFKFLYVLEGMNVFFGWLFFIVLFM